MKEIWGKSRIDKPYHQKTITMITKKLPELRTTFSKEFSTAIDDRDDLLLGTRYYSDDQILLVTQCNIPEDEFLENPDHFLMRVLLGAASTDYYYTFEKQW